MNTKGLLFGLPIAGLFVLLLVGALTFDPRKWPREVGDEATYLMAAQSLAFDFDLRYSAADRERYRRIRQRDPEEIILESSDGGRTLRYGKPASYPLAIAPLVRLMPLQGHAVGNVIWLVLAAACAAWALHPLLAPWTVWFVALFLFGSVLFASVFWAHPDLFFACLVAIGYSLVFRTFFERRAAGDRQARSSPGSTEVLSEAIAVVRAPRFWQVVLSAAVLTVVALARPFYLPLLIAPIFALPSRRERIRFVVAVAAVAGIGLGSALLVRGSWSPYASERQSFSAASGFPMLSEDGSYSGWEAGVQTDGSRAWTGAAFLPFPFHPLDFVWNCLYVIVGRDVGLLPYFLPLLLVGAAYRGDGASRSTWLSFALIVVAFLVVRPFNFWGGGGALANRYLLPAYPALWFALRRPLSPRWLSLAAVAALFLWPLWVAPRAYFRDADGGYHHVSRVARFLPYETTQSHLQPSGREDFVHSGLWIKPLAPNLKALRNGAWIERTPAAGRSSLLIGSARPLAGVEIELSPMERAEPLQRRQVLFRFPRAVHPMWWSPELFRLYELDLGSLAEGEAVAIRLRPLWRGARGGSVADG